MKSKSLLLFEPAFETKLLPKMIHGPIQVRSDINPTLYSLVGFDKSETNEVVI